MSYQYQANGNLISKSEGPTHSLEYVPPDVITYGQPVHAPWKVDGQLYSYDWNGNLTNDGRRTLAYDADNRLTEVVSGTQHTTFAYDADSHLIKRTGPDGSTTLYVGQHYEVQLSNTPPPAAPPPPHPGLNRKLYLALQLNDYQTIDGRTAQATKYYLFSGRRLAQRAGFNGPVTYFYTDHLGSVVRTSAQVDDTRYYTPMAASAATPTAASRRLIPIIILSA